MKKSLSLIPLLLVAIACTKEPGTQSAIEAKSFLAVPTETVETTNNGAMAGEAALNRLISDRECNGCRLRDMNLSNLDLAGVQLVGANLKGSRLLNTNLQGANLKGTNLEDTILYGANLNYAILSEASMLNAMIDDTTQINATTELTNTTLPDGTISY